MSFNWRTTILLPFILIKASLTCKTKALLTMEDGFFHFPRIMREKKKKDGRFQNISC